MKTAELSELQNRIYGYIRACIGQNGYPPTVREIGGAVGISSPSVVYAHLRRLEEAGLIIQEKGHRRAIRLTEAFRDSVTTADSSASSEKSNGFAGTDTKNREIPLVRSESTSAYPFSAADVLEYLPSATAGSQGEKLFAVKMPDEALLDAGILPGDILIIRAGEEPADGELAAVRLDGKMTVRRWKVRRGTAWLFTENPEYPACRAEGAELCGKVMKLERSFAP